VISGSRKNAQVFIYVDLARALADGIQFYKSANGVILSPGNANGVLEPKYFLRIDKK
jgi:2'-phosphotransferase